MKKMFLMVCVASALTAAVAEDSYLYWLVDDTITVDGTAYTWGSLTARVVAYDSSTWRPGLPGNGGKVLELYAQNAQGGLAAITGDSEKGDYVGIDGMNSPYYAAIKPDMQGESWSYFIELYNDKGFYARSAQGLDYMSAQAGEYLMGSDLQPGTYWNVSAFTATPAPEPNSALLMLIGCAALALRRRRQIVA